MVGILIQAAADFHGKESRYFHFTKGLRGNSPDVAILAGDMDSNPSFFEFLEEVEIPVLIVHGNMDDTNMEREIEGFDNAIFLHGRMHSLGGINFVGAGGGNPSLESIYSENEGRKIPIADAKADVLVTHVPPKGIMDRMALGFHIGSKWVKDIMEDMKPRLVLCGHVHEDPGYAVSGGTTVVNCSIGRKGKYTLVEMDSENNKIKVKTI